MRVGHGFDAHSFCAGDHVVIGGVRVPHERAMEAHSDGDVLVHALCDALLGAAGRGDIGRHFPDTDEEFKDVDSRVLLRRVVADLHERGLTIGNVDITVVAQRPRLSPHIEAMQHNIAADLGIPPDRVNVKATTTERMGYVGREEGIAAHAVALVNE